MLYNKLRILMVKITNNTRRRTPYIFLVLLLAALIFVTGYGLRLYHRPLPVLTATVKTPAFIAGETTAIPWPSYGQASIAAVGYGKLAGTTPQKPMPIASVAKLMTALAVLDKKPLALGQAGPSITVTKTDIAIYNEYFAKDGSLVRVQEGELLSQYDALEALLLPSANNVADMLANWAFGSVDAYSRYANLYARDHGMTQSNFADASGFSPATASTADDLVTLGELALKNPVVAEIVAKRTAEIPVAGQINNVNGLLGKYGINGLKTGNTNEAGGVFTVSADRQVDGQTVKLIGAVMGGPDLETAMRATLPLLDATAANLQQKTIIKTGQNFGAYTPPWSNQPVNLVASRDVSAVVWKGDSIKTNISTEKLRGQQPKNAAVGKLTVQTGNQTFSVPLVLQSAIPAPSTGWRINR